MRMCKKGPCLKAALGAWPPRILGTPSFMPLRVWRRRPCGRALAEDEPTCSSSSQKLWPRQRSLRRAATAPSATGEADAYLLVPRSRTKRALEASNQGKHIATGSRLPRRGSPLRSTPCASWERTEWGVVPSSWCVLVRRQRPRHRTVATRHMSACDHLPELFNKT